MTLGSLPEVGRRPAVNRSPDGAAWAVLTERFNKLSQVEPARDDSAEDVTISGVACRPRERAPREARKFKRYPKVQLLAATIPSYNRAVCAG